MQTDWQLQGLGGAAMLFSAWPRKDELDLSGLVSAPPLGRGALEGLKGVLVWKGTGGKEGVVSQRFRPRTSA